MAVYSAGAGSNRGRNSNALAAMVRVREGQDRRQVQLREPCGRS
ncbi:hypothetical protein [Arthrobacter sp. ISL-65]|nr:hypothetical protein [Arthrobacter sp. ISL-65]